MGKWNTGGSRDTNYGISASEYVHVKYRWSVGWLWWWNINNAWM